jgi:tRNA-dihydrouridine synthase
MTKYYLAPLEGITDMVFRRVHRRFYPGVTKYYTPFISPTQNHLFTPRQLRELNRENNENLPLVPQLLSKNALDFLWAAEELAAMGYEEVNLNLGCPSGTVTAKGKGAGFLAYPDVLDIFLRRIYADPPLKISIKTRIGLRSPEEFARLLAIYNQYPVYELTIHPRTCDEQYRGDVHWDAFAQAMEHTTIPLCYNGNLFTPSACKAFSEQFPTVPAVMVGRGMIADPTLVTKLTGGHCDKNTLRQFHDELCRQYPIVFQSHANAMQRMKAIWRYLLASFKNGECYRRELIKAKDFNELMAVADAIFQLPLLEEAESDKFLQ